MQAISLFEGIERNQNLTIMVCQTAGECDLNVGEVCATYSGPPVDVRIAVDLKCNRTPYGKFVRVRQQITDGSWLSLCECVIYSP